MSRPSPPISSTNWVPLAAGLSFACLLGACEATGSAANEAARTEEVRAADPAAPQREKEALAEPDQRTTSPAAVAIPTWPFNGLTASGRLTGTLRLEGRCLVVRGGSGEVTALAFPPGQARWDEEGQALVFKDRRYPIGSKVDLAGGYHRRSDTSLRVAGLPDECPGESVWLAG